MSPEQARGEIDRLGPATDIYALGATLFYMLTGRAPFAGKDQPEIMTKVGLGEFAAPSPSRPQIAKIGDYTTGAAVVSTLRPVERWIASLRSQ